MHTLVSYTAQYFFVVPILLWVGWCIFSFNKQEKIQSAVVLVVGLILAYIFAKAGGHFYSDPRPFVAGHFTPYFAYATDNGFPSDHTLLVTVFAASMWLRRRWLSYILFAMTVIVGLARVISGVHHLVDILGALIFGIVAVAVAELVVSKLLPNKKHSK